MTSAKIKKQENPLVNIAFNVVVPSLILSKLSSIDRLGPTHALLLALIFPIGYGAYDFFTRKTTNPISILGFVSVLLTGGLSLLQVDGLWFACKEAAVPLLIGLFCLWSARSDKPFVRAVLYNPQVIDVERVSRELAIRNNHSHFERLLSTTTLVLAGSFFLSAVLNFGLAIMILKSPAGTEEFNVELGKMTALSYPVIVVPSLVVMLYALWRLMAGIKELTGLTMDDVFHHAQTTVKKP